jgi:hypothetical protein
MISPLRCVRSELELRFEGLGVDGRDLLPERLAGDRERDIDLPSLSYTVSSIMASSVADRAKAPVIIKTHNCLRLLASGLLLLTPIISCAQSISTDKPENDYSKESAVIEKTSVRVNFQTDGTWTRRTEAAIRVKSEAGVRQYGVLVFGYSGTNDKVIINSVQVRKQDGTIIVTSTDSIQDVASAVSRQAPAYSDYREKHVTVKGLSVGDLVEYDTLIEEVTPVAPGHFWFEYTFNRSAIVLHEELEIGVPKDRRLNLKSPGLDSSVAESGDRRIYTWKTSNLSRPQDQPQKQANSEDNSASISLTTFENWADVSEWWYGLEREPAQVTD